MKKKATSNSIRGVLCGLFFGVSFLSNAQWISSLSGRVLSENRRIPLEGVLVRLESTSGFAYTDAQGFFEIHIREKGDFHLVLSAEDFVSKKMLLTMLPKKSLNLGELVLSRSDRETGQFSGLLITDMDVQQEEASGAEIIPGLMQASRDVFASAAAFRFRPLRFKIRGYDSREASVMINGIEMNKHFDGRPQWNNWGGLNTVFKNQSQVFGMAASTHGYGRLLGLTHYSTLASEIRPGSVISMALNRGTYRNRILFSHSTGVMEQGWAMAFCASLRTAEKGVIEGTHYKAWSSFIAVEKRFNVQHRLNLTAFLAYNTRGKSSPNTQEVYDLLGYGYNAYWGDQFGKIRNARVQEIQEPVLQLTHVWNPTKEWRFSSTFSIQEGHVGSSRLGHFEAPDPSPTQYQKLPSYHLRDLENPNYESAFLALKSLRESGQIDWDRLYETNSFHSSARHYLYQDRKDDRTRAFHTEVDWQISRQWRADISLFHQDLSSLNYAKMLDLLGSEAFVDLDFYATGLARQNDANHPNRVVKEGGSFFYRYRLNSEKSGLFYQFSHTAKHLEFQLGIQHLRSCFQRQGLYRNGAYPERSFGKSPQKVFWDFGAKAAFLYKITGRHLLGFHVGVSDQAPLVKSLFPQVRVNEDWTPGLRNEQRQSVDLTYRYRAPGTQVRLTAYHTRFSNQIDLSYTFSQGLRGDEADFVTTVLTGLSRQHQGLEFGAKMQLSPSIELSAVAALGTYVYANNPRLYLRSDQFSGQEGDFGRAYLRGRRLGGTPQTASSLGISYRDPAYWSVGINVNYFSNRYLSISPLIRSDNFFMDADGLPFVNPETGRHLSSMEVKDFWKQEKLSDVFLVNFTFGKSWKTDGQYLYVFGSITNLLGVLFKTGGFEQSRKANYLELKEDRALETPLFGPKYWASNGVGCFLTLSLHR